MSPIICNLHLHQCSSSHSSLAFPSSFFLVFLSVVEAEKQSRRLASLILTARLAYR